VNIKVFFNATSCSLVDIPQSCRGVCCQNC